MAQRTMRQRVDSLPPCFELGHPFSHLGLEFGILPLLISGIMDVHGRQSAIGSDVNRRHLQRVTCDMLSHINYIQYDYSSICIRKTTTQREARVS